jgi:SAM-dependent methyltransferase
MAANGAYFKGDDRRGDTYIFDGAKLEELKRLNRQSECRSPTAIERTRYLLLLGLNQAMHDKPFNAPLDKPTKILEIGCGSCHILTQLAQKFSKARVYGIDPSPPPDLRGKPDNMTYIRGTFEDLLAANDTQLAKETFDYIFVRSLVLVVTDWPLFISRIKSLLKPGGWVEVQDWSNRSFVNPSSPKPVDLDWEWYKSLSAAVKARGTDLALGEKLTGLLDIAGLEDVASEQFVVPITPCPSVPDSQPLHVYVSEALPGTYQILLERYLQNRHSTDKIENFKKEARETMLSGKIEELFWWWYACIGRKPLSV